MSDIFKTGVIFTMKQNTTSQIYLKRLANKIKKERNITHIQALDIAAGHLGFTNFKNFQNTLKQITVPKKHNLITIEIPQGKSNLLRTKKINPHRNLLVAGLNNLLESKLITLKTSGIKNRNDGQRHVFTEIFGFLSIVKWRDIGFGEIEISVWWKYDHSRHPQAELAGRKRENFNNTSPLAQRKLYKNFVGVTVTGWFERENGKHLMGKGMERIVDIYTRKGEKSELVKIPQQVPSGFQAEGKFYF